MIDYINNYVDLALSRLVEQDKENYELIELLNASSHQAQEIEDSVFDILNHQGVFTANGKTLDYIGETVGEKRNYQSDDDYRVAIIGKIAVNNCNCTGNEITSLISLFFEKVTVKIFDFPYAAFFVELSADFDIKKFNIIYNLLLLVQPLGVKFLHLVVYLNRNNTLTLTDNSKTEYNYSVDSDETLLIVDNNATNLAVVSLKEFSSKRNNNGLCEKGEVNIGVLGEKINA